MLGKTESIWKKFALLLAAVLAAGALAGCADQGAEEAAEEPIAEEPIAEEPAAEEPIAEEPIADDEQAVGDEGANVDDMVLINGAVYQCDTFAETTNIEGVCDEYQLDEAADPADFPEAQAFEAQDELVMINDTQYRCDDEFGLGNEGADDGLGADEGLGEAEQEACNEYVVVGSDE